MSRVGYEELSSRPRWITPSSICLIIHILQKPKSLTALLFIQNNSQFTNITKTCLTVSASMLSLSSIVYVQVCQVFCKYSPDSRCHPRSFSSCGFQLLLYIQLTISFVIGQKRTVNFRNQLLGHHLAADYTIIMLRTLKVTGNHVMYDRGA